MTFRKGYWLVLLGMNIGMSIIFALGGSNYVFTALVMVAYCGYILGTLQK